MNTFFPRLSRSVYWPTHISLRACYLISLATIGLLLSGCSPTEESTNDYDPVFVAPANQEVISYRFAIHPLHNPTRLYETFQPMIDYLNEQIPNSRFILEASRDYASFDRKLANENVEFALPNPYQTVTALKHHYSVFAKMGDDDQFRGIFLVRKDSHFQKPTDLIGHSISYPAATALAATMMPQYFLYENGVKLSDVQNQYVGSQESSIMNVYHGLTDAGATWPPPWETLSKQRPELQDTLKVIWQTDSLPNNGLIANSRVPEELVHQVQSVLINLHNHKKGQQILQTINLSKFEMATNETYRPVEKFIDNFTKRVRQPNDAE